MKKIMIALHLALAAMLVFTPIAWAQEQEPVEVEFLGTVTDIDLDTGTLTLETEEGDVYTVLPPEGFDLTLVELEDVFEVEGTLTEEGSVLATKLKLENEVEDEDEAEPEDEGEEEKEGEDPAEEGEAGGYFCRADAERDHPFAAALAETYEADLEQIMTWFCEHKMGFGQIMLALQTAKMNGGDASELMNRRMNGEGWGKIWVDMGLIGKNREAHPPGPPEHAGRPEDAGKPEHAGPPDHAGRPEEKGPPPGHDH